MFNDAFREWVLPGPTSARFIGARIVRFIEKLSILRSPSSSDQSTDYTYLFRVETPIPTEDGATNDGRTVSATTFAKHRSDCHDHLSQRRSLQ